MHASNLLKAVLTPRGLSSNTAGQGLTLKKDSNNRGSRSSSPDPRSSSLVVPKKSSPAPKPVKMSCLCAPTNHAGSFRCRLHRGGQQSWGGRPLTPAGSPPSKPSSPSIAETTPAKAPVASGNEGMNRTVHHLVITPCSPRMFTINFHRRFGLKPSRLSRVYTASDVEPPCTEARAQTPTTIVPKGSSAGTTRYGLKITGVGSASGAVLNDGMEFIKKLQTGGKDAMKDVFGSGTRFGSSGMTL